MPVTEARETPVPDPKEIIETFADVSQRASRLIVEHMQRQLQQGIKVPSDEMGIAKAFMDMTAKLLANPYQMAQAQMNLAQDYFSLWQHSLLRLAGIHTEAVATPAMGDNRFKDAQWEEHFLFDFIKQSYLITSRHIHDTVGKVEGMPYNS